MSDPFVSAIIIACIGDVEFAHEFGKISERRFYKQMKMVVHKNVRVQLYGIDIERLSKHLEKSTSIGVILVNCLPFVSATGDVVDSIRILVLILTLFRPKFSD